MTEVQTATAVAANPFDSDNFSHGGGLWDGKTVTITSAVAKTEQLKNKDGSAYLDEKTRQPVYQTATYIKGISDGGDDKERHEEYSVGDKLMPTPDGEGFVSKDGTPPRFHANSNMGKFSAALKGSGFDLSKLVEGGRQKLSALVGARFIFKAEPKLGKDGKPIKDKKGYDKNVHLPVKFVGYAQGGGVRAAAPAGNGAAAAPAGALDGKATGAVLAALAAGGGKLTRAGLIQSIAQALSGDGDSNAIIGLVVNDAFHKGKPWQYDGKEASL